MAHILGNYAIARESVSAFPSRSCTFLIQSPECISKTCAPHFQQAYFKVEQEAACQQRRQQLEKEGKLPDQPAPSIKERSLAESEAVYETLPEVLRAQARVDDPQAARRRQFDLRSVKPQPEPPTQEDLRRVRWANQGFGATVGHIPRMSLGGRNRYSLPESVNSSSEASIAEVALRRPSAGGGALGQPVNPHVMEVAQRSYAAGVRALVWGSLLGVAALAVGGSAAWQALGGAGAGPSGRPVRDRWTAAMEPRRESVRRWVHQRVGKWRGMAEGGSATAAGAQGREARALQAQLQERYNVQSPESLK
jgi:hypothetical protein